eukprot:Seg1675.6 transcript_id=Seg1675.6/GoldUCD/mRNA.D3Y31 product=Synaptotagmin-1 protein_id=Seg1675.6/GoldUCD/D3Y31
MGLPKDKLKEEILLAISISFGALFFATVITLLVARYYKRIRDFCTRCCPAEEADNNNTGGFFGSSNSLDDKPIVPYTKLAERRKEASTVSALARFPPLFLSAPDDGFTIPGSFYSSSIQPELRVNNKNAGDTSDSRSRQSSVGSHKSRSPGGTRRYNSSTVSLPSSFSPLSGRKLAPSRQYSNVNSSDEEDNSQENDKVFLSTEDFQTNIRPELYNISRQKTMGIGNLGKIQIALQYEDKSRKKLDIFLNKMNKLQINRPDITGIYASIVLLPERESIFTTKQCKVTTNPVFEEKFVFTSRPMNRDFESKTALFLIHYTDRAAKDVIYGEARMPLLCREIYSQVLTDVTLNIKAASMQSEFGDLLVQLIYSESGTLHVMAKMMKVPRSMSLENMSGITLKCYLRKFGSRIGKKTSLAKSLQTYANQHIIEVNGECKFKVPKENFMDCDVTCVVSGRHKILGKKLNLGKVTLGNSSKDETGAVHWKTIYSSPGIAWTVWHPIYSS